MRRLWCVIALSLSVAGLGCHDKPRRILRQPEKQIYDLPPHDDPKFSEPPKYPEEKRFGPRQKKEPGPPGGGLGGLGGAGVGPGIGTGPGGY